MINELCEEYNEEPSIIHTHQWLLFEYLFDILQSDGAFEFDGTISLL